MADLPVYARSSDVVTAEVDGKAILLNTKNWIYLDFDRVGTAIWDALEAPRTLPSLVAALTARFEVDEATCAADIKPFLDDLLAQGVITTTPARPEPGA